MKKQVKIEREYILRTSPGVLFSFLTEPSGLSEWFCDNVNIRGDVYSFIWNKDSEQQARRLALKENSFVRYRWLDGPESSFFELRLEVDDITSELALMITDHADADDVDETNLFWNSAIQKLHSVIGS
ncbi:MAG: SRPBCC domain-containing protein [Bacteroidia bacterium]|nr:SRPBCC domain-containing protein [Bacteroidia bacterium]